MDRRPGMATRTHVMPSTHSLRLGDTPLRAGVAIAKARALLAALAVVVLAAMPAAAERIGVPEHRATTDEFARLPLAAQATISSVLGRDDPAYRARAVGRGFLAQNRRPPLEAPFRPQ